MSLGGVGWCCQGRSPSKPQSSFRRCAREASIAAAVLDVSSETRVVFEVAPDATSMAELCRNSRRVENSLRGFILTSAAGSLPGLSAQQKGRPRGRPDMYLAIQ